MFFNTNLIYPILLILSNGKRSFENMGRTINKSGDTVRRMLRSAQENHAILREICKSFFKNAAQLFVVIDDTLIRKISSQLMQGSGWYFDTKIGRSIIAFRLMVCLITDGKSALPIDSAYLFAKELVDLIKDHKFPSKNDIAKSMVSVAKDLFPRKRLTVVADGLFATLEFVLWCKQHRIHLEVRMHSNRKVVYKGIELSVKELALRFNLMPNGRKMVRTVHITWHGIWLWLTIVRRINKYGVETIVFQAATYKDKPIKHKLAYDKRWNIEKLFRMGKQSLGLSDCYSLKLAVQHSHVTSVLLASTLVQIEKKEKKLDRPEAAIRHLKTQKVPVVLNRFVSLNQIFRNMRGIHA